MSSNLFVIEPQDIPSRGYSITLKEPQFKDRREAMKRMPSDGTNLGYGLEQLMLALSIEKINDVAPNTLALRDPIGKIRELPPADTQFLISLFLELFLLSKEDGDNVKALATQLREQSGMSFTIPKEATPSQKFSITFKQPSTGEQMDIDRLYPGPDSGCGYDLGELLFAHCLLAIDGQPVDKPKELITVLDEWAYLDVQFAVAVFMNLCFIDNQMKNSARELGKKLRRKESSSVASPRKTTKAQPASTDLS